MNHEPIKFLLVDDVEENLVALEALLRRDGLEVLKARSGSEALELLLVHQVALAFLDVQMPGMDGFELAELMRGAERTKHVPIIFVTAGARDQQRVWKGYESGAVDFLFKPIDPHVLKSKADVFFELYRQRHELAENLRLTEMFVGVLGHDLRNPLGAVLSGASLLERQLSDEAQLRTVHRMVGSAQRMRAMVDQLLDLTRARLAGGVGFVDQPSRIDIAVLVGRALEELRGIDASKPIELETFGPCFTSGDATRLLQVFSNLIANAINHGQLDAPIAVTVEGRGVDVVVRVRNRGCIPPDLLPRIFDPFRGGRTTSGSQGLGLGLFISQQIVASHGGTITVESAEPAGTEFTVRIPRRGEAPAAPAESPAAAPRGSVAG